MTVDLQGDRDLCDELEDLARQVDLGERGDALGDVRPHVLLGLRMLLVEAVGVAFPACALLDDRYALVQVADAFDVDTEPEAVEQLRPQLALLRVHGPDEDEPRRMRDRHALALDWVDAHGGGVEKHVNDVVVEKVHLVDVEDVAVGLGQDSGLETARAFFERGLEVDGPDHTVLGGVDGQLDDSHPPHRRRQGAGLSALTAFEAPVFWVVRVAPEDRKSTRLNSSHSQISYAVFCLK